MAKSTSKVAAGLRAADLTQGQRTEQYVKVVNGLYDKAITDLSAMAFQIGLPSDGSTFSFPPGKQKAVLDVIQKMADRITSVIEAGDMTAWNAACAKYDTFVDAVLNTSKLTRVELAKYDARNLEALAAFQQRKVEGLGLSERVWKTVQPFKDEVELAIDTATGEGKSAAELSRDVRSCLKEPDKLFRRVRDKYGNLHLSKAAKLYHPGQGVYRSSYKNAMRMTRTEINMAYRQSDHMRWQQLDFVVGIQVQTSNNHTCLGADGKPHRFTDICDELAGKYPKDFKFVGWHPQCRCFATPVLKTLEEVDKDVDEEGNYRSLPSANEVKDVPANFHDYIIANADRMARWKNTPYYVKDNPQFIDKIFHPEKYVVKALELDAATVKLLSEYEMYGFNHQGSKKFNDALAAAKEAKLSGNDAAFQAAMDIMAFTKKTNDRITALRERKAAESVLTREQKIEQAAQKRHAARTEAKEKELLAFARKHAEETQRAYAEIDNVIARGSDYVDIDTTPLVDIRTAKTGVDVNGKTIGMSLERQRKAAQELNAQVDILIDNTKQYTDLIPDASDFLKQYSIHEIDQAHRVLASTEILANGMPLNDLKAVIEYRIKTYSGLGSTLLQRRLKVVEEDIKIEAIVTDLKTLNITKTSIDPLKNLQQEIDAALAKRDIASADALLTQAKAMSPVATGYETLVKTGYHSGKFDAAMQKCIDALGKGNIKAAQDALNEAATIKATNEANVARRKAREAAKKQQQQKEADIKEDNKVEMELGFGIPEKPGKKLSEAASIDDIREILGEDTPVLLENYDKSVSRDFYTGKDYKKNKQEIELKLKKFFEESDFAHMAHSELLADFVEYKGNKVTGGYLGAGCINNLQANAVQAKARKVSYFSIKGEGYDEDRRQWGHFAYGLKQTNDRKRVAKKDWLRDEDYYRCGTPVPKGDINESWKESGKVPDFYGDAQVIFRKDRVITTFTYGNSLDEETIPSLTCDPKVCSIDNQSFKNYKLKEYKFDTITTSGYIEIQYLPKHSQGILPRDMQSITLNDNPLKFHPKEIWDKWKKEGVDIYYYDSKKRKVVLYQKGDPLPTDEEAKKYALDFYKKKKQIVNADIDDKNFEPIKRYLEKGDFLEAYYRSRDVEKKIEMQAKELDALKDIIPDVDKWHKKFTIEELKTAHTAISSKLRWLETKYEGRNDPDRIIAKFGKEIDNVEHPEINTKGATRYKTWEIASEIYQRKRDELILKYRKASIDADIADLSAFKTKDKEFTALLQKIEEKATAGRWGDVEAAITQAKAKRIELENETAVGKPTQIGECSRVKFSESDFSQAKQDAAIWFKAKGKTAAAMRKAYKEADDYMSQYAEAMWAKLTEEEKHVLWLYTDGSSYINEEMLHTYQLRLKSWIDKSFRNGLADANLLTSIIEKAPALKKDMWMQTGKSENAFQAIFGVDLKTTNISKIVGKEGLSNLFTSCHTARDGAFTRGTSTGWQDNNVIISIFMPKGTKGAYMEPFASFGDSKRGAEGFSWNGKKRAETPSDQVEFLLQRGSKFKITKATYDQTTGKYYIDVVLTEQQACKALNTEIKGLENRRIRYKAPAS